HHPHSFAHPRRIYPRLHCPLRTLLFFLTLLPPPPRATLFPYTTLFRSSRTRRLAAARSERMAGYCRRSRSLRIMSRERERLQYPDRKSTRLNSSHVAISYAVFCLKKKKKKTT